MTSNAIKELNVLIRLLYGASRPEANMLLEWKERWCRELHVTYALSKQVGTSIDIEKFIEGALHQMLAQELSHVTTITKDDRSLPYETIYKSTIYILGETDDKN